MAAVGLGFYAFCTFALAFSQLWIKVRKFYGEERRKRLKEIRLKAIERAAKTGETIITEKDYGPGFRIQKMIPKEEMPEHVFEDYDGKIYDC